MLLQSEQLGWTCYTLRFLETLDGRLWLEINFVGQGRKGVQLFIVEESPLLEKKRDVFLSAGLCVLAASHEHDRR